MTRESLDSEIQVSTDRLHFIAMLSPLRSNHLEKKEDKNINITRTSLTSTTVWCWKRKKEEKQQQQQQQQEQRQQQQGRLSQLQPARRRTDTSGLRGDTRETERASGGQ